MVSPYTIYLRKPVHQSLNKINKTKKRKIEAFIESLSNDPFNEGDFLETDSTGRTIFTVIVEGYAVTYFSDHAVAEVKILELVMTP